MKSSGGIVVVGGMNMDIQGRSSRPFRPGDSNPGTATRSPGGVGRNIAENLVRLGRSVELVTVLGTDSLSDELAKSCADRGIGLSGSIRLPGSSSSTYITIFDHDGSLVGAIAAMEG
ncbi:MAG: PfkB family carbohydrate kinase, partial [Spirochaetaceae bacterium]|nr:PfkB family carbohydrate kinase [Spirochaetaceae bacterium]